jgi:hypothetical protein
MWRVLLVALAGAAVACGGDSSRVGRPPDGCARPPGSPSEDADYCFWGPLCGECAFPGEVDGYYEASPDGCSWVDVWRQPLEDLTREQYERQTACNAAQDGYDQSADYREAQ